MPNDQKVSSIELRGRLCDSIGYFGGFFDEGQTGQLHQAGFRSVLQDHARGRRIDPVAVGQFAGNYAFYGAHTILSGVHRTDTVISSLADSPYSSIAGDRYGAIQMSAPDIAEKFSNLLIEETRARVGGCQHVGLLLSGGMDSRVVAAVLRQLQRSGEAFGVTCFTWGKADTRDPTYARQIARIYNWNFEHFEIDQQTLWNNVLIAADYGCFHSAIHLHAMPSVAKRASELGVDMMVAGSYGDSIGRAEYSGQHVTRLKPFDRRVRNWYGLVDQPFFKKVHALSIKEIARCREAFGCSYIRSYSEFDRQIHYMRNMLGSAMGVIDEVVPLAQAFTSWPVVRFMWSLAPECRTDDVYLHALHTLDPDMLEIPWARTGRPYLRDDLPEDNLKRSFHDYGLWGRMNLERIQDTISRGRLDTLGPFNPRGLQAVNKAFQRYPFVRSGRLLEIVLWLASLSLMIEKFELQSPVPSTARRRSFVNRLEMTGTLFGQFRAHRKLL